MIRKRRKHIKYQKQRIVANFYIRYPKVRVLDERGEMLGIMPTREAIQKAQASEKDLVLITAKAKPPIAKIIELSKYKYQLKQKQAKNRKTSKQIKVKELRFKIFIGEQDFNSKIKKIETFLKKGNKVKISIELKGRQITKKNLAYDVFARIFEAVQEIAEIEIEAKIIGKKLISQLAPKK
ncbi:MAG: translation initiation factor IF-3 [Candidatus Woesebacteria bacterium]